MAALLKWLLVAAALQMLFHKPVFGSECPGGWLKWNNRCYRSPAQKKEWQQARDECQENNGDLASINDAEENDFMKDFGKDMFIGLRKYSDGWKWLDGTSADYTSWEPSQPDNGDSNKKIGFFKSDGEWKSERMDRTKYFVCEKPADGTATSEVDEPTTTSGNMADTTTGGNAEGTTNGVNFDSKTTVIDVDNKTTVIDVDSTTTGANVDGTTTGSIVDSTTTIDNVDSITTGQHVVGSTNVGKTDSEGTTVETTQNAAFPIPHSNSIPKVCYIIKLETGYVLECE